MKSFLYQFFCNHVVCSKQYNYAAPDNFLSGASFLLINLRTTNQKYFVYLHQISKNEKQLRSAVFIIKPYPIRTFWFCYFLLNYSNQVKLPDAQNFKIPKFAKQIINLLTDYESVWARPSRDRYWNSVKRKMVFLHVVRS